MGLVLVIGGARSGKSAFAEELAARAGERVLYVATATPMDPSATATAATTPERSGTEKAAEFAEVAGDGEMAERIRRHRARRPSTWPTLEEPREIEQAVSAWLLENDPPDALILDCLTLLLSNWLLTGAPEAHATNESDILERVRSLATYLAGLPFPAIVVSNETGLGIVPTSALGRAFRDLSGLANQRLAQQAEAVYALWAGIPVEVKSLDVRRSWSKPSGRKDPS